MYWSFTVYLHKQIRYLMRISFRQLCTLKSFTWFLGVQIYDSCLQRWICQIDITSFLSSTMDHLQRWICQAIIASLADPSLQLSFIQPPRKHIKKLQWMHSYLINQYPTQVSIFTLFFNIYSVCVNIFVLSFDSLLRGI